MSNVSHEGRRSWLNGVQKAMVIGGLIEKAGEFEEARQRIRDEANRKRADAANARRDESGKLTMKPVVPQSEVQQAKNGPNPDQKPARDHTKMHAQSSATAMAKAIGATIRHPFVEGKSAVFAAFRLRICPPKKPFPPPMPDLFLGQGRSAREGLTRASGRGEDRAVHRDACNIPMAKPDRDHGPAPAGIIIPDHRAPMRILLTPPQAVGPIIPIGDRS